MRGYILTYSILKRINFDSSELSAERTLISASAVVHCGMPRRDAAKTLVANDRGVWVTTGLEHNGRGTYRYSEGLPTFGGKGIHAENLRVVLYCPTFLFLKRYFSTGLCFDFMEDIVITEQSL